MYLVLQMLPNFKYIMMPPIQMGRPPPLHYNNNNDNDYNLNRTVVWWWQWGWWYDNEQREKVKCDNEPKKRIDNIV